MKTERELLEKSIANQKVISENLSDVTQDVFMIKEDLSRALGYLENDQRTNTKGLVESYNDLEQRVSELELSKKITKGKLAMIVLVLSFVAGVVKWLTEIL